MKLPKTTREQLAEILKETLKELDKKENIDSVFENMNVKLPLQLKLIMERGNSKEGRYDLDWMHKSEKYFLPKILGHLASHMKGNKMDSEHGDTHHLGHALLCLLYLFSNVLDNGSVIKETFIKN